MSFNSFLPPVPETSNYFTLTLEELIASAFEVVQIGVDGEAIAPEYYQRAVNIVNLAIQEMQTQGLHLTTYRVGYLFLQPSQYKYVIEDENSTNEYWQRTISTAAIAGDTVLAVSSTSDATVGDYFGITLTSGALQWTTISSIDTVLGTITIADPLTGAAAAGQYCLNYTTPIRQISRIHQVWRRDNYVTDVPVTMLPQQEYDLLPFKTTTTGLPSMAYYYRGLPKGTMFLWTLPVNSQYIIGFWYESKIGQMKDPTDAIDLDQFYLPALTHTIALRMCNRFGISTEIMTRVKAEQEDLMGMALTYDDEQQPIKFSPNRRV